MLTLQRSPLIVCADMLDQVNFEEDPALTDLGSRYLTGSSLLLQRHRMNLQKISSLLQGKGTHGYVLATIKAGS